MARRRFMRICLLAISAVVGLALHSSSSLAADGASSNVLAKTRWIDHADDLSSEDADQKDSQHESGVEEYEEGTVDSIDTPNEFSEDEDSIREVRHAGVEDKSPKVDEDETGDVEGKQKKKAEEDEATETEEALRVQIDEDKVDLDEFELESGKERTQLNTVDESDMLEANEKQREANEGCFEGNTSTDPITFETDEEKVAGHKVCDGRDDAREDTGQQEQKLAFSPNEHAEGLKEPCSERKDHQQNMGEDVAVADLEHVVALTAAGLLDVGEGEETLDQVLSMSDYTPGELSHDLVAEGAHGQEIIDGPFDLPGEVPGQRQTEIDSLFDEFDFDSSSLLEEDEVRELLPKVGAPIDFYWRQYDADEDGMLSKQELIQAMNSDTDMDPAVLEAWNEANSELENDEMEAMASAEEDGF
eukprot:TRINITY_DN68763_c0_g1_i1.p1 TRINITY_DN68763_c0_g1~~TRINITY_DN68763_c0_g1_i1.p1  ORF type:complete len:417 (-),score=103.64 TRINITY_DN68763_c0_g1_i1:104-1354(-)